jgi:preprotein translocase subunit SecG
MRANPWKLIQAHYRTLRDAETGKSRWRDYALFLGFPAGVYVLCIFLGTELPPEASAGLLTATGVLAAFFFGVVLQVAQRAMDLADQTYEPKSVKPDKATYWQIEFLKEIAASAGYACLISVLAAAVSLAALAATSKWLVVVFCSLSIALGVHLALLLTMVLSRVYALIVRRLRTAKVGGPKGAGTVHPIDAQRSGSSR